MDYERQQNSDSPGYTAIHIEDTKIDIDDYLFWSIFNFLCCSSLFGAISMVFSLITRTDKKLNQHLRASLTSKIAYKFNLIATLLGFSVFLIFFIIYMVLNSEIH